MRKRLAFSMSSPFCPHAVLHFFLFSINNLMWSLFFPCLHGSSFTDKTLLHTLPSPPPWALPQRLDNKQASSFVVHHSLDVQSSVEDLVKSRCYSFLENVDFNYFINHKVSITPVFFFFFLRFSLAGKTKLFTFLGSAALQRKVHICAY